MDFHCIKTVVRTGRGKRKAIVGLRVGSFHLIIALINKVNLTVKYMQTAVQAS